MKPTVFLVVLNVIIVKALYSQDSTKNQQRFILHVERAGSPIEIDGELNEDAWKQTPSASRFLNKWPLDTGYAEAHTDVKMTFNESYLYIAAINYQKREDLIIQTLKRDQVESFWTSDGFSVLIDPINLKNNAFLFGVNAGGAQMEGVVTATGSWARLNANWDNTWFSSIKVFDDYWVAELAIPFTALRFQESKMEWGLNFIRNDMKRNAYSTWAKVPLQFNGIDLGYMGTLQWSEPITSQKSKVTLIPYGSTGYSRNHEEGEDAKLTGNAGLDAKIAVTSSLNLDLTYRPDFSNVEVDRQMTNVTRFSLLFPERRNFFLENADLFTNLGSWMVKPFFSRRIGLHKGEAVPIVAGARLSGNVTNALRIGVMDIQTESIESVSASNYFVGAVEQRLLSRSSIKFFAANRETTKKNEGDDTDDFNRASGAEMQYTSTKGDFNFYLRAHSAYTPDKLKANNYYSSQVNYINNKLYAGVMMEKIGENYVNDFAFVPKLYNYDAVRDTTIRIGHYTINPWLGILLYPKKWKKVSMIEPNTWSVIHYRTNGDFLERFTSVNLSIVFKDSRKVFIDMSNNDVVLPYPVDLLGNKKTLPVRHYTFTQYSVQYSTDTRKALSAEARLSHGNFYNGTRSEYGLSVNLRKQPWGVLGVSYLQNDITLSNEIGSAKFMLIGPNAEISFSNTMWWTTFIQYNTQAENVNINSRFQWRFKPMSDIFLVYTDDYTTTGMKEKNRGVILKMTYWLNM